MKKILTILICFSCFATLKASHLAGGEIWYEYAGDSLHPNRYVINLRLYRDVSGAIFGSGGKTVCVSSSCFSNFNVYLNLVPVVDKVLPLDTLPGSVPGSILTPDLTDCVDSNSPGLVFSEAYLYQKVVDLPGKCSNFMFSYAECCRNNSSTLHQAAGKYFYFEAYLNNTASDNSSPRFVNPAAKSFCVGIPIKWSQTAIEPDGDSLYYALETPLDGRCGSPGSAIPYATNFSLSNPITTTSGTSLNHTNGTISFTPAQPEVVSLRLVVYEYRVDTTFLNYYQIGTSTMDIQIPIVASCGNINTQWVAPADSAGLFASLHCGDSLINLSTRIKFISASLAPDGSDFALIDSHNKLVPIIGAGANNLNGQGVISNSFWLKLNGAISYNDTLKLITRIGNDLNTMLNTCGMELAKNDTALIMVQNCNTSVGLNAFSTTSNCKLYPNPAKDNIHLSLADETQDVALQIFDATGRVVYSKNKYTNESVIDLQNLDAGMYVLKATNALWTEVAKFEKL